MFTSQIFSRSVVLSSAHFILSLPLFSDVQAAQPPSMSSHYQILSVLYFGLLSNPCFLSSNAAIVSQKSLCLNWKPDKSLFFFKFLQPYFLTLKTPSNHSEYKYSHFTGARQYIPESRDELLF